MNPVLVTGAAGFVGRHLARELRAAGRAVAGFDLPGAAADGIPMETGRIEDADAVAGAVARLRPSACVHLAGIASDAAAWRRPDLAFRVNVGGTLTLLEAFRAHAPGARVLVVSSAQVYGGGEGRGPLDEEAPLAPAALYGLTKLAADRATLLYAERFGLAALTVRPVNHIGPGQSDQFVVSSFACQLAAIAAGARPPELRVGNLDSRRDFMDVRDTVRGYRLLLERGRPGRAYNLAAGQPVRVGAVLDRLCDIAGVRPRIAVDPALFRPTDASPALDTARVRADTGWTPEIPLDRTLRDIYAEARADVASAAKQADGGQQ